MNEPLAPVVSSQAVPVPAAQAAVPDIRPPAVPAIHCQNCGAVLQGEYCAACGQRHEPHVHTVGHFAAEAFESISHADSRLWLTIGYLLARPGFLTREFFAGRRARYLPPFRLYIVISVLFFVVTGLAGHLVVQDSPPTAESVQEMQRSADSLEAELPDTPGIAQAAAAIRQKAAVQQETLDGKAPEIESANEPVRSNFCEGKTQPGPGASWDQQMLWGLCQKVSKLHGRDLINDVAHNIPKAMFVFLPLLALFMKLLYWRPKRHYVEHLLFLVHNHAFVFLAMGILAVTLKIPVVGEHLGLLTAFVWLYSVYYIFRAMRVYYGQSRTLTLGKYLVVGLAYVVSATFVLAATALYSALTL